MTYIFLEVLNKHLEKGHDIENWGKDFFVIHQKTMAIAQKML